MSHLLDLMPLPSTHAKRGRSLRRCWDDPDFRAKQVAAGKRRSAEHMARMVELASTPEAKEKKRLALVAAWQRRKKRSPTAEERAKQSQAMFRYFERIGYQHKMIACRNPDCGKIMRKRRYVGRSARTRFTCSDECAKKVRADGRRRAADRHNA